MNIQQKNIAFGAQLKFDKKLEEHVKAYSTPYWDTFTEVSEKFEEQTNYDRGIMVITDINDIGVIKSAGYIRDYNNEGKKDIHVNNDFLKRRKPALHQQSDFIVTELVEHFEKLRADSQKKESDAKKWDSFLI